MKILLSITFFCLTVIDCINPPHSNKFDPKNPDKAILEGRVYMYNNTPLPDATISLILDGVEIEVSTSDSMGNFKFIHINPGIYEIQANAEHFTSVEFYPESLPAGTYIENFEIYFHTFDFEDETPGDSSPYGFRPVSGTWLIKKDSLAPDKHSAGYVYCGKANSGSPQAISINEGETDNFMFETNFKVAGSSDPDWSAGIIFVYQNSQNYYLLRIVSDSINLYKVIDGAIEPLRLKYVHFSNDNWYRVEIQCSNSYYVLRLNGEYLFAILDKTFIKGSVGLYVASKNSGDISVSFDDITIQFK